MLMMSAQRSKCVGRRAQLEALLRCWDRAASGQTVLALVTGEAGIGKTRMAAELAVEVHRRGGQVLLGASTDGAQMAYQPFVDALSDLVAATPESQLRSDLSRHVHTLPRLFPGQVSRLGSAMRRDLDPLSEREELQAALAMLVTQLARRRPTLIVLEDMHWASAVTREAVLHVARVGGTAPLLLVVTTRDTPPDLDRALTTWLAAAGRLPSSEVISVAGLDIGATAELLDGLAGHVDPAGRAATHGRKPALVTRERGWGFQPDAPGPARDPVCAADRHRPRCPRHCRRLW